MIHVTRLNNEDLIVNSDLIEFIEVTPDTVLTLTTGKKVMVRESADEILARVTAYRAQTGIRVAHQGMNSPAAHERDLDAAA